MPPRRATWASSMKSSSGDFASGALQYAQKLLAQGAGPRPTSARSVDARALTPEFTARWQAEARRLYPNRTAALTAIEAVQATTRLPFDEGLLFEDKLANQTKATVEAKASIHVFFAERESRKIEGLPTDVAPRSHHECRRGRCRHHGRWHRHRVRKRRHSGHAARRDPGIAGAWPQGGRFDLREHGETRAHRRGRESASDAAHQRHRELPGPGNAAT